MNKIEYERVRSNIAKRYKGRLEQLELEILKLNQENLQLRKDNQALERQVKKYKAELDRIPDSQKTLLGMTQLLSNL